VHRAFVVRNPLYPVFHLLLPVFVSERELASAGTNNSAMPWCREVLLGVDRLGGVDLQSHTSWSHRRTRMPHGHVFSHAPWCLYLERKHAGRRPSLEMLRGVPDEKQSAWSELAYCTSDMRD
jgi:hypothetical protein